MSSLQISQGTFRLSDTKTLHLDSLTLNAGDSWAFVGANGSGKSALARALAGELPLLTGERQCQFTRITRLSFEQLQKLVSDEWQRNNTDMLSPGEDDTGRTTAEIIQDEVHHPARCAMLAQQFGISALLNRRFKYLSTGETRKALLCQALMSEPELLILDEPFDGLDVTARQQLAQRLTALNQAGMTLALVLNRFDEIPDFVQFAGVLADCTLAETGTTTELLQRALVAQLAHSERLTDVQLPEPDEPSARHALPDGEPRIVLNDGVVSYNDRPILHHLSWRVNPGEHWRIVGITGRVSLRCLALLLAIIRKATATISRCSGGGEEAAKQSGISKNISATSAAVYIWITASVPRCAMSFSPAISILSAFTRPFQTGNENWRNSGWIFWESISVRQMPPSTVSPGDSSGWR